MPAYPPVGRLPREVGVLRGDRCLERDQLGRGVDAERVAEQLTEAGRFGERLVGPAAAVEREEPLHPQPLPVRVLADQLLELWRHRTVAAGVEVCLHLLLDGDEAGDRYAMEIEATLAGRTRLFRCRDKKCREQFILPQLPPPTGNWR